MSKRTAELTLTAPFRPEDRSVFPGAPDGWKKFVAKLLSFPGRHDDQVDALTQGLAWGRQQWSRKVTVSFYRY